MLRRMKRWSSLFAVAALGTAILGLASARSGASGPDGKPPSGGIFQVVFAPPEQLDTMDPAIANTQASWSLLDLTCARLMNYPDKPPPQAFHLSALQPGMPHARSGVKYAMVEEPHDERRKDTIKGRTQSFEFDSLLF